MDVVGRCKLFSGLISMSVFDILHIPSGCIQSFHPPDYGPVHAPLSPTTHTQTHTHTPLSGVHKQAIM